MPPIESLPTEMQIILPFVIYVLIRIMFPRRQRLEIDPSGAIRAEGKLSSILAFLLKWRR
jgi:hypothetical protein